MVYSLLQLPGGNEDDEKLHCKLMHSHYSHLHKRDYCLHCLTDGFDVFSGFDCLY